MTNPKDQFTKAVQPPYYDVAAYDEFMTALSAIEAVVGAWNIAMYAAGDKYTKDIITVADKLPLDIVLRDLSAVVCPMALLPHYPLTIILDKYVAGRVNPLSFTDNYAALVYYDFINDDKTGTCADKVELYGAAARRAFQAMGSLEAQVTALDHAYGINEDDGAATDITSLPLQSQNLLKELFVQTATSLLQVCNEAQAADAIVARKLLTARLEMAETILGHSDLVHTIEGMYLADLPAEAFSEGEKFRIDPAAGAPKPV